VSGFSPPDILLMWLEDKREVNPSWFASTHPMAQAGNKTFRSWSILRLPATAGTSPATYTCVVRHEASRTMLNASKILDTVDESYPGRDHWTGSGGEARMEEPLSSSRFTATAWLRAPVLL
jgi:hypothetical protein